MYLRVRDEYGAIREYRQSSRSAEPGQLIKVTSTPSQEILEKGDIVRVDYLGRDGKVVVGGQTGYTLTKEEYLSLVPTSFLWFKRVRHKEIDTKAKQGDRIIVQLASGKYMILSVQRVKDEGVVAQSDDFTKFVEEGNYKVIVPIGAIPLKLKPYYTVDKIPKAGDYVEVVGQLSQYGTSEFYPTIYQVAYRNSTHVSVTEDMLGQELVKPLSISLSDCEVLEFTEEYTDKVFTVKQVVVDNSAQDEEATPLGITEDVNELKTRVELLELVFDDMFSRLTSSLYLKRRDELTKR